MRLSSISVFAIGACNVRAFRNTSPFLYFSTAEHALTLPQITTSSSLISSIESQILGFTGAGCSTHTYIVTVQPGLSASDLGSKSTISNLRRWLSEGDKTYKSKLSVAQVTGDKNSQELINLLSTRCARTPYRLDLASALNSGFASMGGDPSLIVIDMPKIPAGEHRDTYLRDHDAQLATTMEHLPKRDYKLFFTSTPPSSLDTLSIEEQVTYEMDDSQSPLRTELKRDLSARQQTDDVTLPDGPLFERFQFLTPGVFMGILTILLLVAIGYGGVSALASIQVSYAAFDKENGPQAQRNKAQ